MAATWLSLTSAASLSDMRWLTPPPQRTAYFCRARRPGIVLRVSRTRALVPPSASAHRAVSEATPLRWQSRLSARAFGGEQLPGRGVDGHQLVATHDPGAVGDQLVDRRRVPADHVDHGGHHRQTGHGARATGDEVGPAALLQRHGGRGRHVDAAVEVLGDRGAHQGRDRVGIEAGSEQQGAAASWHRSGAPSSLVHHVTVTSIGGSWCTIERNAP